jgi:hypothetical protein
MDSGAMTDGKREWARPVGRPPIQNPATKRVAVKVTPEQHKTWLALGASKWLKRMLETASALEVSQREELRK